MTSVPGTDAALRERAARVIPGGLWGHMRVQGLPRGYPQFFRCRRLPGLWDADGRSMTDYGECKAYMAQQQEQMAARAKAQGGHRPAQPRHDGCAGLKP
jgi:glutamate-1-semialdehyde 2,1-aminomutase